VIRSDLLQTFVAIVEAGSLNAAARRLGRSRSVVSDRLSALESDLGTDLVTRSTHGLSLTAAGTVFLAHARDLLAGMDRARDAIAQTADRPTGHLRLAVPAALGQDWLGPILADFLARHEGIEITVEVSDRTVDIVKGGFDVAIRSARHPDSDLIASRLTTGRRMVVCSPGYADVHGGPTSVRELNRHVMVTYGNRRASADWTFRTADGVESVRVSGRFTVDSGVMMRDAVAAGLGVTLLPNFLTSGLLLAGRLVRVDLGLEPEADTIAAIYPRNRRDLPRLQALIAHLREALGDPPPWDRDLAAAGLLPSP